MHVRQAHGTHGWSRTPKGFGLRGDKEHAPISTTTTSHIERGMTRFLTYIHILTGCIATAVVPPPAHSSSTHTRLPDAYPGQSETASQLDVVGRERRWKPLAQFISGRYHDCSIFDAERAGKEVVVSRAGRRSLLDNQVAHADICEREWSKRL